MVHAVLDDIGAITLIGVQHKRARRWSNLVGLDIRRAWSYLELLHSRYVCTRYSSKPSRRASWLNATVWVWPIHFAILVGIEILLSPHFVHRAARFLIIQASAQ